MLLVYTHKITPRFSYIMKHILTRILGIEILFTTKVEDFIKHNGPKITYTKQPLQNEFFVRSNDLLFEKGINDLQINVGNWDGVPCFFTAGERSNVPYDIFSACFYLLSRYEEYLPHVKDIHGRFPPTESMAFKHGFLKLPVVDLLAFKFLEVLKLRFPNLEHGTRQYRYISIIDVTTSHCYAHRGFLRGGAGFFLDLFSLKPKRLVARVKSWIDPTSDPYDNFSQLIGLHKKYKVESMFFFQFADYSTFDKNVSPHSNRFRFLIKSIADYSAIALAASYSSFGDIGLLKKEKKQLSNVVHRSIDVSRMRYNRVDVPQTYRNLVEAEFTDDYTMGYTHEIGFRASTCTPFYFYDINLEIQQPVKLHPFAVHDYAFPNNKGKEEIMGQIESLYRQVKGVNGELVTIFSNELLGSSISVNWMELYESVISAYHV
jgi:hypothetical protein